MSQMFFSFFKAIYTNYIVYNKNFSAEELFPVRREMFFGMKLPVPNQVDAVLEKRYGPDFLTKVPDVSRWLFCTPNSTIYYS